MSKPKRAKGHAAVRDARRGERWLCAREEMQHIVLDEGRAWRPDAVAWFTAEGLGLASRLVPPETPESVAADLLEEAMARPLPGSGMPRRPRALVAADEALRAALAERYGGAFEVTVGDVSPADEFFDSLAEQLGSNCELPPQPLLEGGLITPAMAQSWLDAMREFYEAVPWSELDDDPPVIRVRIAARGIDDGCAQLICDETGRGFSFFRSVADYEGSGEVLPRAERPLGTRHFVACFDIGDEVFDERCDELRRLGWDDAFAPGWFPGLAAYDYGECLHPLSPEDFDLAIVCARALSQAACAPAGDTGGAPRRLTCEGLFGAVDVEITTPHPGVESGPSSAPFVTDAARADIDAVVSDFMNALERSADEDDHGDWTAWAASGVGIFLVYMAEQQSHGEDDSAVDLRALTAEELADFLLDYSPRKVSGDAASTSASAVALSRFFAWLKAEGHCPAARCDEAVATIARVRDEYLRRSLDRSRFGMAKSFFMGMVDRGVDIHDPAQVDAYTAMLNRGALDAPTPNAPPTAMPRAHAPKVRWEPAPGDPAPAPNAPCPCGSGRRYRKCCMRR